MMDSINHRIVGALGVWLAAALMVLMTALSPQDARAAGSMSAPPLARAASDVNSVVAWLRGAEVQAENDAQRAELRRGLRDMLHHSPAELRARRYAGADGTPAARTLPELLTGHLVPRTPQALDEGRFFEDAKKPAAQRAVRRLLRQMKR